VIRIIARQDKKIIESSNLYDRRNSSADKTDLKLYKKRKKRIGKMRIEYKKNDDIRTFQGNKNPNWF